MLFYLLVRSNEPAGPALSGLDEYFMVEQFSTGDTNLAQHRRPRAEQSFADLPETKDD